MKELNNKLQLKKETLAVLNEKEMKEIEGGMSSKCSTATWWEC